MLYEFDYQTFQVAENAVGSAVSVNVANEESDGELMARIQRRDESALSVLMARHKPLLKTIISRVVDCDADAEDVFQELWMEIWNQAERYNSTKGLPLGWIVTMTRRRAIDRVRRRSAYNRAEERLRVATLHLPYFTERGVDEEADDSELGVQLREALSKLPEYQRQVVELAFMHGLSQREIAKQTGTPLGTIKTRIELGMRKLKALASTGGLRERSLMAA